MDNNLRIRIRNALEARNQISFQQVVNKIFVYRYKKDFTPVKPNFHPFNKFFNESMVR